MAMQVQDNVECYEKLANAIIVTACQDYRKALKNLKKNPRHESSLRDKADVERFLRSRWYGELTSVDGETLIRMLNEEVDAL